jgi:hypothetical protein
MTFFRIPPAALLALALGACTPAFFGPSSRAPAPPRTPPAVNALPQGLPCLEQLGQRGSVFDVVADRVQGACRLSNGVTLKKSVAALDKPALLSCPLAVSLSDFETFAVQPTAQKYFRRRVVMIRHLGAYDCRTINGSRKMSQHAYGRAVDVAGFDLEGGMRITVEQHWKGRDERAAFLHEIARQACSLFSVVLTPDSDADHYNHIHLDIGPDRSCAQ